MKITICGGGNLGHVTGGFLASDEKNEVSLLTTRPERWAEEIVVYEGQGARSKEQENSQGQETNVYRGHWQRISAEATEVITDSDMVLLCLPGYAIGPVLEQIKDALCAKTWVGSVVSSTGFFFEAMKRLPGSQPLFGFQRVPFISRIIEYGHSAELKGYKESLNVAVEQTTERETIRKTLEELFHTPVNLLDSYYAVSLSNSNPLLHPSRLYTLWKDWQPGISYDNNPGFYEEWTDAASKLLISMDDEFQRLLVRIGLKAGCIPPILDYYESEDAPSLTRKIQSISAFKNIASPMVQLAGGKYIPDFKSRYFTEDFPYGMRFIVETAHQYQQPIPVIERVYKWGCDKIAAYEKGKDQEREEKN